MCRRTGRAATRKKTLWNGEPRSADAHTIQKWHSWSRRLSNEMSISYTGRNCPLIGKFNAQRVKVVYCIEIKRLKDRNPRGQKGDQEDCLLTCAHVPLQAIGPLLWDTLQSAISCKWRTYGDVRVLFLHAISMTIWSICHGWRLGRLPA